MLKALKEQVLEANLALPKSGLVTLTWGNVSGIDENRELMVIKPSGVAYDQLKRDDLVVLRVQDGGIVEGTLRPSSDTPAHRVLYQAFTNIGGIVHTHSPWATAWAQAGLPLPMLGTTHADFARGPIPCTRDLDEAEVAVDFEAHTGLSIVQVLERDQYQDIPAVLVKGHGPFCWGKDAMGAVTQAIILEEVAKIAHRTLALNPGAVLNPAIADRHFSRKHGPKAYYGQGPETSD